MRPKTILIAIAVVAASFFVSLKVMDWLSPRGTVARAGAGRIAAAAARAAQLHRDGAGRDRAVGHSRRRRSRRAAQFQRQGRQSGIADSAERRYRLDRLARADHRDRRAGRAVAGDAADRNAERHGLAVVEGDGRDRRRARRAARRQCRQADRQREHQARSTPAPRSRATSSSPSRPKLAAAWRIEPNLAAQVNLGDTSLSWPAPASTCRRRSSR